MSLLCENPIRLCDLHLIVTRNISLLREKHLVITRIKLYRYVYDLRDHSVTSRSSWSLFTNIFTDFKLNHESLWSHFTVCVCVGVCSCPPSHTHCLSSAQNTLTSPCTEHLHLSSCRNGEFSQPMSWWMFFFNPPVEWDHLKLETFSGDENRFKNVTPCAPVCP